MFSVIRKVAKVKPPEDALMKQRSMAITYFPVEPLGYRFRLRSLDKVQGWNDALRRSGVLNYPLTEPMRFRIHDKKDADTEVFMVFATLRKLYERVH